MKRFISPFLIFMFLLINSAHAATLYGWDYGYNKNPDLGTVYTTDAVSKKVTLVWFRNRINQLMYQLPQLQQCGFSSDELAKELFNKCKSGQIMSSKITDGTKIIAVSSGSGRWYFDREWTGESVNCWLFTTVKEYTDGRKIIIHWGIPYDCGNLVLFCFEFVKPKPTVTVNSVPVLPEDETPKYQTPPMYAGANTKTGEFAPTVTLSSGFGITPQAKISANSSSASPVDIDIANTLQQLQQQIIQFININQTQTF